MSQKEIRRLPNTNRILDEGKMSEEFIAEICKANGGFRTPELNEKIYLHFRGFRKIEGLGSFVNCRALWLENNIITDIEGLDNLPLLDSLFLQYNHILRMPADLGYSVASLRSINISHNAIVSLNGIEHFPNLEKVLVAHNHLECIVALGALENLSILDVSHNRLAKADEVRGVLRKAKKLASVMMHGNSFIKDVKHYRKVVIDENPLIRFLDEYPVFDDERRCAAAFVSDGVEGEAQERAAIRKEEADRQQSQRAFFTKLVETAREQRTSEPMAPTTYFQQMQDDDEDLFIPSTTVTAKAPASSHPPPAAVQPGETKAAARRTVRVPTKAPIQRGSKVHRHVDVNASIASDAVDLFDCGEDDILSIFRLDATTSEAIKLATAVPNRR
jgi:dynein assembly factor 1, axonemal